MLRDFSFATCKCSCLRTIIAVAAFAYMRTASAMTKMNVSRIACLVEFNTRVRVWAVVMSQKRSVDLRQLPFARSIFLFLFI